MSLVQEDGSFSPFGYSVDRRGSIWITALTVSALRLADSYTNIDPSVIAAAMSWLVKNQVTYQKASPFQFNLYFIGYGIKRIILFDL